MFRYARRFSAYAVYLILSFGYGLGFTTMAVYNILYQAQVAHLNPLQLTLVGTTLETVCFLCQVPTGVLADLYSRRLSVIVGVLLVGTGFVLEGSIPQFLAIALAQGLFGVGATFMSGAEEAWIASEVGEEQVGHVFVRGAQISQVGNVLGALLGAVLASIRLNLPVVVGGSLLVLLGILMIFIMPENGFRPTPKEERQSWRGLVSTFRSGMRAAWSSSMLLLILGATLLYGLASEGFDRLNAPHLLQDFAVPTLGPFSPLTWFALIAVAGNFLAIGGNELMRRLNLTSQRTVVGTLVALNLVGMAGLLVFALSGNFWLAVVALLCVGIFRSLRIPLFNTWLTRNSPAQVRATLISLDGQMDALGQIAGGPPVGYLGSIFSLRVALAAVGFILTPILLLYAAALRCLRREPATLSLDEEAAAPIS